MNKKQKNWIENYYIQTGFECMRIDDLNSGKLTWEEFVNLNQRWFEDWSHEALRNTDWKR